MQDLSASPSNPLNEPKEARHSPEGEVELILAKWHEVELLLERSGRADKVVGEMEAYVADLRDEAKATALMRKLMVAAALAYVVFVNLLLVCMLFYHKFFFLIIGEYGRVALILATISSSVVLVAKILMGLFKTHGERHKDEFASPTLQQAIEATKIVINP
ncbi:hypothetical protein F9K73_06665 [Brucella intermedia]|uniref:hypothetical protein n=1 Tax=Brucella intermedia TaxID=94625 RepID=UPI00124BF924|nr:hypothetical protein [Brucella intermedia]KAB2721904.1 hypothetical protein F9K73_06665 [Brucella intermedia]